MLQWLYKSDLGRTGGKRHCAGMEAQCSHSPFMGSSRCLRLPTRLAAQRGPLQTRCAVTQTFTPRVNELGKESRVGKAPIAIPKGVSVTLTRESLKVKVRLVARSCTGL